MPLSIQYVAKRGLVPGHFVDAGYEISTLLSKSTSDTKRKRIGKTSISIGGHVEYDHLRTEETKAFVMIPTAEIFSVYVLEFLRSVEEGEQFVLDETGTAAAPDNPRYCIIEGNYAYKRLSQARDKTYQVTFTVRYV